MTKNYIKDDFIIPKPIIEGFTEESEEKIKLLKNVDLVIQDEVVQMLDLTFEKSQNSL